MTHLESEIQLVADELKAKIRARDALQSASDADSVKLRHKLNNQIETLIRRKFRLERIEERESRRGKSKRR